MLRLNVSDRTRIMHILDRLKLLSEPRIFRRFFATKQESRLSRVRQSTHDYIGLTFRDEGKPKEHENTYEDPEPIKFVHLSNPLFSRNIHDECSEEQRAAYIKSLKECIRSVNRIRPKFVVATGACIDETCRKLLTKISETIPFVICDGSRFLTLWHSCNEVVILCGDKLCRTAVASGKNYGEAECPISSDIDEIDQMAWLEEELEQIKVPRRKTMVFIENDPRSLPRRIMRRLAKGGSVCVLGCAGDHFRTSCDLAEETEEELEVDKDSNSEEKEDDDVDTNEKNEMKVELISSLLTLLTLEAKYGNWTAQDISPQS